MEYGLCSLRDLAFFFFFHGSKQTGFISERMNLWLLEAGKDAEERIVREFGIGMCALLYLKWITNKVLVLHMELY